MIVADIKDSGPNRAACKAETSAISVTSRSDSSRMKVGSACTPSSGHAGRGSAWTGAINSALYRQYFRPSRRRKNPYNSWVVIRSLLRYRINSVACRVAARAGEVDRSYTHQVFGEVFQSVIQAFLVAPFVSWGFGWQIPWPVVLLAASVRRPYNFSNFIVSWDGAVHGNSCPFEHRNIEDRIMKKR